MDYFATATRERLEAVQRELNRHDARIKHLISQPVTDWEEVNDASDFTGFFLRRERARLREDLASCCAPWFMVA